MATYVYETIPQQPGDAVRRFEVRQSMKDEPLKNDPETGLPVKRVIMGGFGIMTKAAPMMAGCGEGQCAMPEQNSHVCAGGCCCRN